MHFTIVPSKGSHHEYTPSYPAGHSDGAERNQRSIYADESGSQIGHDGSIDREN